MKDCGPSGSVPAFDDRGWRSRNPRSQMTRAFTLVELLVSMAVLALILGILLSITDETSRMWMHTSAKIEEFRAARTAFDTITRRLSQATLNTYWDYERDASGNLTRYVRQSELRFLAGRSESLLGTNSPPRPFHGVFFQAPLGYVDDSSYTGLENLLNTWGYFVEFNNNADWQPPFVQGSGHYRFRLMEMLQPANSLTIYQYTSGKDSDGTARNLTYTGREWFSNAFTAPAAAPVHVLAENVIALVILPKLPLQEDPDGTSLSPNYSYDSTEERAATPSLNPKNQLPPIVEVTMVALDENSANRLELEHGSSMPDLGLDFESFFVNANEYARDLKVNASEPGASLEEALIERNLNYRIFSTNISIRAAKWSTE